MLIGKLRKRQNAKLCARALTISGWAIPEKNYPRETVKGFHYTPGGMAAVFSLSGY